MFRSDHHDQQVRNHHDVNKTEDGEHDGLFVNMRRLLEEVSKFDKKVVHVDALGDDEPEVKRRLQPATEKRSNWQEHFRSVSVRFDA